MFRIKKPLNKIAYSTEGDHVIASLSVEIEDDKDPGVVVDSETITSKIHKSRSTSKKITDLKKDLDLQITKYLEKYAKQENFDTVFASVQIKLENTTWEESA